MQRAMQAPRRAKARPRAAGSGNHGRNASLAKSAGLPDVISQYGLEKVARAQDLPLDWGNIKAKLRKILRGEEPLPTGLATDVNHPALKGGASVVQLVQFDSVA